MCAWFFSPPHADCVPDLFSFLTLSVHSLFFHIQARIPLPTRVPHEESKRVLIEVLILNCKEGPGDRGEDPKTRKSSILLVPIQGPLILKKKNKSPLHCTWLVELTFCLPCQFWRTKSTGSYDNEASINSRLLGSRTSKSIVRLSCSTSMFICFWFSQNIELEPSKWRWGLSLFIIVCNWRVGGGLYPEFTTQWIWDLSPQHSVTSYHI